MSLSSPRRRERSRSHSSPTATLSPAPLPTDNGVHNITRKVIRRLEGLGHLEMVDIPPTLEDDTDIPSSNVSDGGREGDLEEEVETEREQEEVEKAVYDELTRRDKTPTQQQHQQQPNGHLVAVNGNGIIIQKQQKVDWEIPRKLLHSSIGPLIHSAHLSSPLPPSVLLNEHFALGFFTLYLYVSEGDVSRIVFVLWSSLCIIVPADILRLRWPAFERLYERMLGFLMRESEKVKCAPLDPFNHTTLYSLGGAGLFFFRTQQTV